MKKCIKSCCGVWSVIVLVLALAVLTFVIKLAPVYWENHKVLAAIRSVVAEATKSGKGYAGLTEANVLKRLEAEDLAFVKGEHITVKRVNDMAEVQVKYKAKKSLFSNVDMVVTFDDVVKSE